MTEQRDEFIRAQERMVRDQISSRDVTDPRVLEAMRTVPRHLFVSADLSHLAYADAPLPIGHQQTISQPYIVALMTQLLELQGDERVLEIGTGSGYQAAILSCLAKEVFTIERIPELADIASERMKELGFLNVEVIEADGSNGLPEHAPYQGIIVTAAAPRVPAPLKSQLAEGGKLVIPVGSRAGQILERWTRQGKDFNQDRIAPVAFVPLVGDHGWKEDEPRWFW